MTCCGNASHVLYFHLSGYVNKPNYRTGHPKIHKSSIQRPLHSNKLSAVGSHLLGALVLTSLKTTKPQRLLWRPSAIWNVMQLLLTRFMSSWSRSFLSIISTRWGNNPYSKGIKECSARNFSTKRHSSWRWCCMACAFTWSLRLWLLLMGYQISKFFISKPRTIEELKQCIKDVIAAIPEQMTRRVMENRRESLEQCLRNGRGHLNDGILKNKMAYTEFFSDKNCYIIR
jgi:hypothetical protein